MSCDSCDSLDKDLIVKRTLCARTKCASFKNDTKVQFHFQTRLCNAQRTLLDDSRKMSKGKPLDLILGKKFKLEVWEVILRTMGINEIAQFTVDKSLVMQYPFVAKTLRDLHRPVTERRQTHCCAMTMQNEGVGYHDLDAFLKNPTDLEFTMEIVNVEQPEDYVKEIWQLGEDEKRVLIPKLREQGNIEYKNKNYLKAAELYSKAVGMLEQLMLKEKPHDEEWNELNQQKNPILLNFAQCKLKQDDYYAVIEHCTTVLQSDRENVKAYFRRAMAHVGAWNVEEARRDFIKVLELDKSLASIVGCELAKLEKLVKQKDSEDKERFCKLFAN